MLRYYYDKNEKDNFETLFTGTYIYDHPTQERNSYYILHFDFSGLNTESIEELKLDFYERVKNSCSKFLSQYQIDLVLNETENSASYLSNFLSAISTRIKYPVYVFIDEYDHFANELLSFTVGAHECHLDDFHDAVSKNGYVRKFYEVLHQRRAVRSRGPPPTPLVKYS